VETASIDAFVANYVLDLLPDDEIRAALAEAWRILRPSGCLCAVSLTHGRRGLSRLVSSLWKRVHSLRPALVGGCRPLNLSGFLDNERWQLDHANVMVAYGIPSEIVIASPV
jgi:hypothetical protein